MTWFLFQAAAYKKLAEKVIAFLKKQEVQGNGMWMSINFKMEDLLWITILKNDLFIKRRSNNPLREYVKNFVCFFILKEADSFCSLLRLSTPILNSMV